MMIIIIIIIIIITTVVPLFLINSFRKLHSTVQYYNLHMYSTVLYMTTRNKSHFAASFN